MRLRKARRVTVRQFALVLIKQRSATGRIPISFQPATWSARNLTMRMSMRRFTRLTNAHSKKLANHKHAVAHSFHALQFRPHQSGRALLSRYGSRSRAILRSIEDIALV